MKSHSIILKELHQAYIGCLQIKKDIQAVLWLMFRVAINTSIFFLDLEYVCIRRLHICLEKYGTSNVVVQWEIWNG